MGGWIDGGAVDCWVSGWMDEWTDGRQDRYAGGKIGKWVHE